MGHHFFIDQKAFIRPFGPKLRLGSDVATI
jgi:hypothetical protein